MIVLLSSMNEERWCEQQLVSWHSLNGWSAQILAESACLVIRALPSSWWRPWESKQQQTRLCYHFQPNDNKKKIFFYIRKCIVHFWLYYLSDKLSLFQWYHPDDTLCINWHYRPTSALVHDPTQVLSGDEEKRPKTFAYEKKFTQGLVHSAGVWEFIYSTVYSHFGSF